MLSILVAGGPEHTIARLLSSDLYRVNLVPTSSLNGSSYSLVDCVILHNRADELDAMEVLGHICSPHGSPPCAIIVIGSETQAALATAVLKAGALDYLAQESLNPEMLGEAIRDSVRRFSRETELNERAREHAHLAALVAASSDAIVSLAEDGRCVRSWSVGAERLFGYSELEAIGKTIDELIIPESKNSERLAFLETTSRGRSLVVETERHTKTGDLIDVEINVSPMSSGYAVIFRDIRDRRRVEREMRRSQEQLAAREAELTRAQRIARIGSYEVECRNGRFINRRSPEYLSIHGLPPESHNEPHEAWVERMHPDDRRPSEQSFKKAMIDRATEYEAEYRIIRPSDGDTRWIKVLAEIDRDASGAPIRLFGTHIDITERKLAEEALKTSETRLRLAAEAARLGLFEVDWKTQRRHWSKELRNLLAVPDNLDISDDADLIDRIIPSESREEVRHRLAQSFDPEGSREYEYEHEVVRLDGSRCFVLLRGRTLFEETLSGPRPSRTVGLMMDITARKIADRQRELLLRELDHRLKNIFATVSSMVGLSARSASSVDAYAKSLRERLYALSAVHNLVRGADLDNTASLTAITSTITTGGLRDKISARGPDVILPASMVIALGMILNELLTNAIKYGALSAVHGKVALSWKILRGKPLYRNSDGDEGERDMLTLRWRELGGPPVERVTRTGFGTRMIQQSVAVMDGNIETEWQTGGLVVTLTCPLLDVGHG